MRQLLFIPLCILIVLSLTSCITIAPKVTEPELIGEEWPADYLPEDLPEPEAENDEFTAYEYDDIVWIETEMTAEQFFAYTEALTGAGYEGGLTRVNHLGANCAFADIDLATALEPAIAELSLENIKIIDEDAGWDLAYTAVKDEDHVLIFRVLTREGEKCFILYRPGIVTMRDYYLQKWY